MYISLWSVVCVVYICLYSFRSCISVLFSRVIYFSMEFSTVALILVLYSFFFRRQVYMLTQRTSLTLLSPSRLPVLLFFLLSASCLSFCPLSLFSFFFSTSLTSVSPPPLFLLRSVLLSFSLLYFSHVTATSESSLLPLPASLHCLPPL